MRIGKFHIKSVILLILMYITLFCIFSMNAQANESIPETVRIGLYFSDQRTGSAPVSSVSIYCASGIDVAHCKNNGENSLIFNFRFLRESSRLELFKYSFSNRCSVAVVTGSQTLSAALWTMEDLATKGYSPLLAYVGSWKVLVGGFDGLEEASAYIDGTLRSALPGYNFEATNLSGIYTGLSVDGGLSFIFDAVSGDIRLSPANGSQSPILVENRLYRGHIEVLRTSEGDMTVVNVLSLNDYLYGVVPREIQAVSNAEALKAQAVAARTYTINSMGKHQSLRFDLCNETECQVYGGMSDEDVNTTKAVDDTNNEIVRWQGDPAQVFYFASSGGHTENVKNVWGTEFPYLEGVEDRYESGTSYRYRWETTYTAAQIRDQLLEAGVDIGNIRSVSITAMSDAGRAIEVTVTGTKGSKIYENEECRYFLKDLYSQLYNVRAVGGEGNDATLVGVNAMTIDGAGNRKDLYLSGIKAASATGFADLPSGGGLVVQSKSGKSAFPTVGDRFTFSGRGWGHGVGMSQEGAKGMAAAGFTYIQILKHYFPGCDVG